MSADDIFFHQQKEMSFSDCTNMNENFWFELNKLKTKISEDREAADISKNIEFPIRNTGNGAAAVDYRSTVLLKIEKTIESLVQLLSENKPPSLSFANVNTWNSVSFERDRGFRMSDRPALVTVSFDSINSVKKLGLTLRILSLIYVHVQRNTCCTKRDIFYQDPQLFGSQACLDGIVEDIAHLLQVPRWQLHVMATSKGLVAGDLQFIDAQGNVVDCAQSEQGILVPNNVQEIKFLKTNARFLLVIEKDATFQKLMEHGLTRTLGPCILVTGKGFPDVSTRMLLNRLWEFFRLPMFGLFDADPHGLEIMTVYKFGSRALCSEGDSLAVPSLKWLGILPSDIEKLHITPEVLIPLTKVDNSKAMNLMKRPFITSQPNWKHEIDIILKGQRKAEIQCLDSISHTFLSDVYIPNKLRFGGWL